MKKWILLFSLLLVVPLLAGDWLSVTIVDTIAADSSDSGLTRDTFYTDTHFVGDWNRLSWNYEIYDIDTNFSKDSIEIQLFMGNRRLGTFIKVPGAVGVDTIFLGANDTIRYTRSIIPGDSMFDFLYGRVVGSDSLLPDNSEKLAGNVYESKVRIFVTEKK